MKNKYITPELEMIVLLSEDIMQTSGDVDMENPDMWEN